MTVRSSAIRHPYCTTETRLRPQETMQEQIISNIPLSKGREGWLWKWLGCREHLFVKKAAGGKLLSLRDGPQMDKNDGRGRDVTREKTFHCPASKVSRRRDGDTGGLEEFLRNAEVRKVGRGAFQKINRARIKSPFLIPRKLPRCVGEKVRYTPGTRSVLEEKRDWGGWMKVKRVRNIPLLYGTGVTGGGAKKYRKHAPGLEGRNNGARRSVGSQKGCKNEYGRERRGVYGVLSPGKMVYQKGIPW